MYEMTVPGKPSAEVPPHLAGTVAVSLGQRFLWRFYLVSFYTLFVVVVYALLVGAVISPSSSDVLVISTDAIVAAFLIFYVISTAMLVKTGASPFMRLAGVRWVRIDTGAPAGWKCVGKLILENIVRCLLFGVGQIIVGFASMDEMNRTWFDRTLGIVPINTRAGRDTYKTPVTPQSQAPAQPVVQPWNATASAAASLPPVPSVPSAPLSAPPAPPTPEPEATHVPWGSAIPDPSPAASSVPSPAVSAPAPSSDYIGATPWSTSGTGVSTPAPEVAAPPLSFTPPSSSYSGSAPATSHPEDDDADDRTQLGVRYDTARVTFDTGVTYPFGGTIVLGRNPLAPASHPTASPVPVDDPQRSVSKTHVALTATREGVLVEDLHSTGGTVVVRADGEETPVLPGAPVHARAGDTVRYGQRSVVIDG